MIATDVPQVAIDQEAFLKMVLSGQPLQQPKVHAGKHNVRQGSKSG